MNEGFQVEARYEHGSTEMMWLWDEAPSAPEPPDDGPGWMLLAVVPQVYVEHVVLEDGGRVRAHILCIWRRRLTVPKTRRAAPAKRGKVPSARSAQAKKPSKSKRTSEPPAANGYSSEEEEELKYDDIPV